MKTAADYNDVSVFSTVPESEVRRVLEKAPLERIIHPTPEDLAREAQRQREANSFTLDGPGGQTRVSGRSFDEVYSVGNVGEATRRLIAGQNEAGKRLERLNFVTPYTIINLMPFPLRCNGILHSRYDLGVPAAPIKQRNSEIPAYASRTLSHLYWDNKDHGSDMQGVDNYEAIPWTPLELAEDFVREYCDGQKCGGVFIYSGDKFPEQMGSAVMHLLKEARHARNVWCEVKVQEANIEDSNEATRKNITEIHRNAWRILFEEGLVDEKDRPRWLTTVRQSTGVAQRSCSCGKPVEGPKCLNCANILDPLEAYRQSMIEFGHISFDKMSELEYAEALEIKDVRDARRKRAHEIYSKKSVQQAQAEIKPPEPSASTEKFFSVIISDLGPNQARTVKAIADLTSQSVARVKASATTLPFTVKADLSESDARSMVDLLAETGALAQAVGQ